MGEFNVNKNDGSLEQTAGMPDTYPADNVMMSDGTTSVEDALDEVTSGLTGQHSNITTGVDLYRVGGLCTLKLFAVTSSTNGDIAELPEGNRPQSQIICPVMYSDGTSLMMGYVIIEATGSVSLFSLAAAPYVGGIVYGTISYSVL